MKANQNELLETAVRTYGKMDSQWDQKSKLNRANKDQKADTGLHIAKKLMEFAMEKKPTEPVLLQVSRLTSYADYIVILTSTSRRHSRALASFLARKARESGIHLLGTEGDEAGEWVLLDFGDVIVHIFQEQARDFYDMDGRWIDAKRLID